MYGLLVGDVLAPEGADEGQLAAREWAAVEVQERPGALVPGRRLRGDGLPAAVKLGGPAVGEGDPPLGSRGEHHADGHLLEHDLALQLEAAPLDGRAQKDHAGGEGDGDTGAGAEHEKGGQSIAAAHLGEAPAEKALLADGGVGDARADVVHHLPAQIGADERERLLVVPASFERDRAGELVELGACDIVQCVQLVGPQARAVDELAQAIYPPLDLGRAAKVRLEVDRIVREQIAALARLRVGEVAEEAIELQADGIGAADERGRPRDAAVREKRGREQEDGDAEDDREEPGREHASAGRHQRGHKARNGRPQGGADRPAFCPGSHGQRPARGVSARGVMPELPPPSARRQAYERDGFLVLPEFVPVEACRALIERADALMEGFDPGAHRSIFSTYEQTRTSDEYFLGSGPEIRFFFVEGSWGPDGELRVPLARAINKLGHALHDLDPVFDRFSRTPALAALGAELGLSNPRLLQSMYIFKQPHIGGEVVMHQDATFLYTEPVTVTGLWFALEEATLENGCLWAVPGGHRQGLKKRFLRAEGGGTRFEVLDPSPIDETGAVPLEVPAGTLVVLHGLLPHRSAENRSARSRHAYAVHVVEAGAHYPADNWLQRPDLPLRGFS
jgi:phytanoyl-CoA hydroxylase